MRTRVPWDTQQEGGEGRKSWAICLIVQVAKTNEASHPLHLDLAWIVGHCLQSENKGPRNRTVLLKVKERERKSPYFCMN